ncbi:heterokaryon incompatibility protein-domain-containing protein [Schizothecium vesticola]|uniref:Heterokaryon incompatibility protein-domain-containing protein n=1 Tax=Schizothecium vesticola TaxID=314040 RepID=A0AA40BPN0_9PEZI|nr:heterokaryon incompatibility protein-domain-containing protein [Schizothecium vesticola]
MLSASFTTLALVGLAAAKVKFLGVSISSGDFGCTIESSVTAIRAAGATSQIILLPGLAFSSPDAAQSTGAALAAITNPDGSKDNLLFALRRYLDDEDNNSGQCTTNNNAAFETAARYLRGIGRQAVVSETGVPPAGEDVILESRAIDAMAALVGPYRYAPLLPGRQIRVLLLYPDYNFTAPLRCSLLQLSLDQVSNGESSYEALSYVWGSENRSHKVLCDGHTLTVTRNCFLALKHLRLVSQARALWVDAICIDQSSISERNQQVRLMGDIYKLSLTVLIWLGEGDTKTDAILRRARKLDALCSFLYRSQLTRPLEAIACHLFRLIAISDLPREWFTRAWTFQELILANRPALVCGFSSSPWNERGFLQAWWRFPLNQVHPSFLDKHPELVACLARLLYYGLRKRFAVFAPDQLPPNSLQQKAIRTEIFTGKTINPNDPKFARKREDYTMAGSMDPFAKGILYSCQMLLTGVFQRKTVDPRDVVFCLHGIMSDLNFRLPEPDYSLPVSVIYENFAVSIMRRTNSLIILTTLLGVFGTPDWPTWVPELSKRDPEPESREPPLRHLLWWDDNLETSGCRFRPTFQLVHQSGRLTVEGIKFSTIASIGSILRRPTPEQLEEPGRRGHLIFDAVCWFQDLLETEKDEVSRHQH